MQDTADRMGMTPKGVRHSISISEGIANGVSLAVTQMPSNEAQLCAYSKLRQ